MRWLKVISLLFILIPSVQGTVWLPFEGKGRLPPQVEFKGEDEVEIAISGIEVREKGEGKEEYQLLRLPGEQWLRDPGKPQLPQIIRILAIAPGEVPEVEVIGEISSILKGYNIYPAPQPVIKRSPDGTRWVDYRFTKDETLYSQDSYFPSQVARIEKTGWLRGQRIAWLSISPIQFNPQEKTIRVYTSLRLKVKGASSLSPVNLGPLEKLGKVLLLNYPQGMGNVAVSRRGGVGRPQDLRSPQNQADYLIISPNAVYQSQWLDSLAEWRAENNGFQVAIVQLSDIYDEFPSSEQDQSIKDFLTYAYENWSAPGMGDGHLGYLLLVGDAAEGDPIFLPTHYRRDAATDHWYACLNDDTGYDTPDILLGRFSIGSEDNLEAEVEKTLSFERASWDTEEWKRRILLYSGFVADQVDLCLQDDFGYIRDLVSKQERFILSDTLYRSDYSNPEVGKVKAKFLAGLNQGRGIINVYTHGAPHLWGDGYGWHMFYNYEVANLENFSHYPVVLSYSCDTGWFDSLGIDCLGEAFVKERHKGAVAFLGSSRVTYAHDCIALNKRMMEALVGYKVYNLGQVILWGKLKSYYDIFRFNLLGDPALSFDSRPQLGRPDLAVSPKDISIVWFPSNENSRIVLAQVHNLGRGRAEDVRVAFWDGPPGGEKIGEVRIGDVDPLGEAEVSIPWEGNLSGRHQLYVQVDPEDSISEISEGNNLASIWVESPQFVDVAGQIGIGYARQGGVWGDYDGDGDPDLLLLMGYDWPPVRLLENERSYFSDITSASGIIPSNTVNGATWGDYDNDGDLDLYLVGDGQNYLYQNRGSTIFVDVSQEAGVDDDGNGLGAVFLDLDNDGYLDILLENYSWESRPLVYFHNNGDGSFFNLTSSSGLGETGDGVGMAVGDYDNDGDLDLYILNEDENLLLQNQGDGSFRDVTSNAGVGYNTTSLVATFGDYDNDGDQDLYLGNYRENILYRNNGDGSFSQVSSGAEGFGESKVVSFLDYNNDGWLDLLVVNDRPGLGDGEASFKLYRNKGMGSFEDVPYFAGNLSPGGIRGISPVDYDLDGWIDLLIWNQSYLLRNWGEGSHWIKVKLKGLRSNADGLGAWVKVAAGDLIQSRMLYPSTTLFPCQPLLFGLGDRETVDSLVVRWPGGRRSLLTGIGVDQTIEIQEPLLDKDLSLQSILSPYFRLNIGDTIHPQIMVRNIGGSEVNGFEVSCQIDSGGVILYSQSIPGHTLSSLDTVRIFFPPWSPPSFGRYEFNFDIDYPSDQDTSNNQRTRGVNIAAFSEIITDLPDSGIGLNRFVSFGDYDRDDYSDLLLTTSNSLRLYENQGGQRFNDVSEDLGLPSGSFSQALFLDYNNDGFLDILALRGSGHPRLLENERENGFTEVSEPAGLSGLDSYVTAAIADYDRDGWVDLFLTYPSWIYHECRSILLKNIDGKFSDYTLPAGVTSTQGFSAPIFLDYNNDGDLDLFLTGHYSTSFLYRNNGDGTFTDVADSVGLKYTYGEDVAIGDYDNDGDLDLYLVKRAHECNSLYQNDGEGNFSEVASSAGVDYQGTGGKAFWADYDNDGDLDLFFINEGRLNILYQNQGDGTFRDRAWEAGIDCPGGGEACAFSDIDRDGYLDFYIVREEDEDGFFHNDLIANHWLEVKLSGILCNSWGIGSKVELFSEESRQVRWLTVSKGDYLLHFGLGENDIIDSLRVYWPSGKRHVLIDIEPDRVIEITEPLLAHDLRVEAILSPSRKLNLGEPFVPRVKIRNVGQNREEEFQVSYTLDKGEDELFSEVTVVPSLESLDTITVSFPPWTPKDFAQYTLTFEVILPSDLNPEDNLAILETVLPIFSSLPFSGLSGSGANSITLGDYNNDGRPDLYLGGSGRLYRNEEDGTFPDVTQIAGVGEKGRDVLFFDYDNDGDEDLLIINYKAPDILFKNRGDGTFAKAEIQGGESPEIALTVADYDRDGYLDLFILGDRGVLLHNLGDGSFEDRTKEAQLETYDYPQASLFFDYDLDGDEDLFILTVDWRFPNQLYRNNGDGTFEDVAGEAGVKEGGGWEITVGDYDNDGLPDIFILGDNIIIYHNEGEGKFKGYSDTLGFEGIEEMRSGSFGDYDNDGWLDLNLTSVYDKPNTLLHNQEDGTFSQLGDLSGFGDRSGWFGSIFFDYDGDGDQDLYLMNSKAEEGKNCLYQNNLKGNNWLNLRLVGRESNRDGIGALVKVVAGGLVQVRESSFGFRFHTLPWLHFGLGRRLKADTILVRWPSGIADTLVDIRANRTLVIEEGDATERYGLPKTFFLSQNYPNPFNALTVIRYGIPYGQVAKVKLTIYDILGRKVRRLFEGEKRGGFHRVKWDGRNSRGEQVASGIYFYRLEAKSQGLKTVKTRKMVLLK